MTEKHEILSRKSSKVEENIKKCANSLENLIYHINNEFCLSLDEIEKREKKVKKKYYKKIFCFSILKDEYANNERILKEIDDIKQEKDALKEKLELMAVHYMSQKENQVTKDLYSCISKKSLVILLLSIFHFYSIAEINGFLFSLFGEIKRSSYRHFKGNYTTNKTFTDFFTNSTLTDSSQINFNYFTSIFTSYFICKYSIMTLYAFSSLALFGFIYLISNFNFLNKETINMNKNYEDSNSVFILIIFYIGIYFFAGLIALLPYELLKVNKKITSGDLLLMNFFLTLAVIVKNLLHDNFGIFKSPFRSGLFYICSSFIFFIYIFILWLQNKFKDNQSNEENEENIDDNNHEDNYYDEESNYINEVNYVNFQNDINIYNNDDSLIEFDDIDESGIVKMLDINQKNKCNNINNENKKKNYFTPYYIFGYLILKFERFIFTINIKSFSSFIYSILSDTKIILILLINLLSRAQKLKFKTIYKNEFNKSIYYLIGNFSLSYVILFIFSIYFFFIVKNKKKIKNQKLLKIKECYIINAIIIDNFVVLIFSILNIIFPNPIFSYLSISISGNLNFLLYEYYSTIEREYMSMSGFIPLAQIIFRLLELIFEPCPDYWLYIQIGFSIVGIIASLFYFKFVIINEEKNEVDINNDNYQEIMKNIFNYKFYIVFFIIIAAISIFIFLMSYSSKI